MGPSLSMVQLRAMAPVRGTKPKVGRRPVTPQRVEGEEMEPSVSEPMAKPTQPAATALAGPAEEPLEPWLGFHGLRVCPPNQLSPMASAPRVNLATSTAPACVEPLDHGGVFIDDLVLEAACAPGGGIAFDGEQILGAPGNAVQRAAVLARGDLVVGFSGLRQGAVFGEGDDEVQRGIVALEAGEVHLGQVDGGDLAAADEVGEVHRGLKGKVFKVRGRGEGGGSFGVDGLLALGVDGGAGGRGSNTKAGATELGRSSLRMAM